MKAQTVPDTRGLDPAIHLLVKKMDPRVKPWVKPAGDPWNDSKRSKSALGPIAHGTGRLIGEACGPRR
jgi:hypothetical protein